MPDLLTTKQLAQYLQLSERSIYRLVEQGEIPSLKVGGQWRFRKSAVDEWLDLQVQRMEPAQLDHTFGEELTTAAPSIFELLSPDNILLDVSAVSKREVLATLAERVTLPDPVDRDLLLARLLEREALCTTALADGIAVPHTPRARKRLLASADVVAIARTKVPIEFGALDGKPTDLFVLVLARDERMHVIVVAKVSRLVREAELQSELRSSTSPQQVLRAVRAMETRLFARVPLP